MSERTGTVDHYGANYQQFASELYAALRTEAFGEDIGQNGWLTVDEQDLLIAWLQLRDSDTTNQRRRTHGNDK